MNELEQARKLASAAVRDISALCGMGDAAVFAEETVGSMSNRTPRSRSRLGWGREGTCPLPHDFAPLFYMLIIGGTNFSVSDGLKYDTCYTGRLFCAGAKPGGGLLDRPQAINQEESILDAAARSMRAAVSTVALSTAASVSGRTVRLSHHRRDQLGHRRDSHLFHGLRQADP
ncbi:MAG: hypothetical protein OXI81_04760 [Paracoccaceae bacterium]|nr:hypothetical protein [Paracoccaceae bacterium]